MPYATSADLPDLANATAISTLAAIPGAFFVAAARIFFGYYPARRTAAMQAVDALWFR